MKDGTLRLNPKFRKPAPNITSTILKISYDHDRDELTATVDFEPTYHFGQDEKRPDACIANTLLKCALEGKGHD